MSASQQLLLGGKQVEANYIEDVFSTYLYTGNGAAQTINNGIDLAGKGGLVWQKYRNAVSEHGLTDTVRGAGIALDSSTTGAQATKSWVNSFTSTGFVAGAYTGTGTQVSWTFRKQPKFFDVVTYTGNQNGTNVPHSLVSTPAFVIVKRTDSVGDWYVWNVPETGTINWGKLNSTAAFAGDWYNYFDGITPTSFVPTQFGPLNINGATYVAYFFAHNAGGFGATGTDNVISCGGFTADGSGAATVSLGYEPQWLLVKRTSSATDWQIYDSMRGFTVDNTAQLALRPNTSTAESAAYPYAVNSTGFSLTGVGAGNTFIYIAIRRGPMKVPTDGTKVYATSTSDTVNNPEYISNFPVDMEISTNVTYGGNRNTSSRLLQGTALFTNTTAAEFAGSQYDFRYMNGWATNAAHDSAYRSWNFRRAPGFFDEVCYTGTGTTLQTLNHNLTVQPELIIIRKRSLAQDWRVASTKMPNPSSPSNPWWDELFLNTTGAVQQNVGYINNLAVTTFQVAGSTVLNQSGTTYVTYLFATCPGVSKVFSFTGNGSSQTINCGFTGGSRFILIKCTSTTGDWYVWDTARGVVSGTDPHLSLNTTAAEVTTDDTIDPDSSGFIVNQVAATNVNVNGATYIGIAIS